MKGILTISLDTELAWGRIAEETRECYMSEYQNGIDAIQKLLNLFDQYSAPVTWALVGRLVDPRASQVLLEDFYPNLTWKKLTEELDETFNGNSVLEFLELPNIILKSEVGHEIASHSYNHILFDNEELGFEKVVEQDIALQNDLFKRLNICPCTIVFPRNKIGYLNVFKRMGYEIYRSADMKGGSIYLDIWTKLKRQIELLIAIPPATFRPVKDEYGMVNYPSSLLYRVPSQGIKRLTSIRNLTRRAVKGIDAAISRGEIFHLYFHPFNFGYKNQGHFEGLESILAYAQTKVKKRELEILTIKESVRKYCLER